MIPTILYRLLRVKRYPKKAPRITKVVAKGNLTGIRSLFVISTLKSIKTGVSTVKKIVVATESLNL